MLVEANIAASRAAARNNAGRTPEEEVENLYRLRQELLDKKLNGTISKRESHYLDYVRWSLDRIEDARYGAILDRFEEAVRMQEQMASSIDALKAHLDRFLERSHPR
jgi:hypothetical protein